MPLVVPGITSNDKADDKTQEWMSKLAGKKISEEASNETVYCPTLKVLPRPFLTRDDRHFASEISPRPTVSLHQGRW